MLVSHTIRFATDIFGLPAEQVEAQESDDTQTTEPEVVSKPTKVETPTPKYALLISKTPINCANKSAVTGLVFGGTAPAKTSRRLMWRINNKNYTLNTSGNLVEYAEEITAENVIKDGQKPVDLAALTSIPGFVGKKIYPIIALRAPADVTEMPTLKMSLKTKTTTNNLTDTQESPVFELTNDSYIPRIVSITAETATTGAGAVTVKVKVRDKDEVWSDWMKLADAADLEAGAVQFQMAYSVTTPGGADTAQVKEIVVEHTLGKTVVSGDNAELYSTVSNYTVPLQMCIATVRHEELRDSTIDVYVNYMRAPSSRELIQIGVGNGQRQELVLGVGGVSDLNIDVSSIVIYVDGEIFTDFDANSAAGTVVMSAKKNASIYASYDYNHAMEVWRKMTKVSTEPYTDDETWLSRYEYVLPDDEAANKVISNIKIVMKRPTGKVTNANLGKATGKKQLFALPHLPKMSTIKFSNSSVTWDYNEDSEILSVVAPRNTDLVISYSWVGEEIRVRSWSAAWSLA